MVHYTIIKLLDIGYLYNILDLKYFWRIFYTFNIFKLFLNISYKRSSNLNILVLKNYFTKRLYYVKHKTHDNIADFKFYTIM